MMTGMPEISRNCLARPPPARLPRRRLWHAQTPQCFRYELLRRAYAQPGALLPEVTDDSALVERLGAAVRVVQGGAHNFKLTTPRDFALAEMLLKGSW